METLERAQKEQAKIYQRKKGKNMKGMFAKVDTGLEKIVLINPIGQRYLLYAFSLQTPSFSKKV